MSDRPGGRSFDRFVVNYERHFAIPRELIPEKITKSQRNAQRMGGYSQSPAW